MLNRILLSNASDGLKNRARIIITYLETPDFNSYHRNDNIAYGEVRRDPALYDGVHVVWRGRASNIETTSAGVSFDFLVVTDNFRNFEGFVPVAFNYAVSINPERPLEVLGKIVPDNTEIGFSLSGVNFHQSSSLDN